MSFFGKEIFVNSMQELFLHASRLRQEVRSSKMILIRGLDHLSTDDFKLFSSLVGGLDKDEDNFISWDFGYVMELKEDKTAGNYLFTNEKVPFHWDGAFHDVPELLVFNAINGNSDGRTLFTDTEKIIECLSENELEILSTLEIEYRTEKIAHYGGKIIQKVIETHPITGRKILRIGEEVPTENNPVKRIMADSKAQTLVKKIDKILYEKKYCYAHKWEKGDLLIADNYSLLHGREEFVGGGQSRHIRRIQIR